MGINGFGRIGRLAARVMLKDPNCKLLAINSGADVKYMAYQFKYDSVHGRWPGEVDVDGNDLIIDGQRIKTTQTRVPSEIPWGAMGVDYLCESTGKFLSAETCKPHIDQGIKKVVFSAPAKDSSPTIVFGVNENEYTSDMTYVSCASCTTNGLAPMVKAIHDKFGIEEAFMTTVHAMTASQMVVDGSSKKDWRGGRSGPDNIIPSTTGAAKAVGKVIPSLKGKITGMAFRVPVGDVSVVDVTAKLSSDTTIEAINEEIRLRASTDMKGFLGFTDEPLVSQDFVGSTISCTYDSKASMMLSPRFAKLVAWYDNEYGYANRVVDLMVLMAQKDGAKRI